MELRASLMAQLVKNWPVMQETWEGKLSIPVFWPGENSMDCIVHGIAKSWT